MATALHPNGYVRAPLALPMHRFSVDQYQQMVRTGVLTENDRVELLEGWIVDKMPQHPLHAATTSTLRRILDALLPQNWIVRVQQPITSADSEPEPDLAVVRGPEERYFSRHPTGGDTALVIEVSDSSLGLDRSQKLEVYAAARIPGYWIVNLITLQVETYSSPRGGKLPAYRNSKNYSIELGVPVIIGSKTVGHVAVRDLFPKDR